MKKRLKDVWKPMLIVAFLFILGSFLPNGKQILFYMAADMFSCGNVFARPLS